jgi:hypothetical protein
MADCCQNLTLGALSSRSALSVLVGALFKRLGLLLKTPHILLELQVLPSELMVEVSRCSGSV